MEELKKHVDRKYISELTIDAKQREKISLSDVEYSWPGGYLWIKISASKVYIWAKACGDKPGAIADYLREKIPWRYAWRPENWNISIAIVFGITLLLVMALLFTMVTHDDRLVFWLFPLNGAFPIVALVLLFTPIFGGSKIMLYSTGSETTFWERNSDKIKLSIFSLLGGIVGAFLTWLFQ